MHAREMISTHPDVRGNTNDDLIKCIEECLDCAQICAVCADACLGEKEHVQMLVQCIRLNLDCADVCRATAAVGARRTGTNEELISAMLKICAESCAKCAEECERHADMHEHCRICAEECERHADMHEHCRICAESCRRCEDACNAAIKTFH